MVPRHVAPCVHHLDLVAIDPLAPPASGCLIELDSDAEAFVPLTHHLRSLRIDLRWLTPHIGPYGRLHEPPTMTRVGRFLTTCCQDVTHLTLAANLTAEHWHDLPGLVRELLASMPQVTHLTLRAPRLLLYLAGRALPIRLVDLIESVIPCLTRDHLPHIRSIVFEGAPSNSPAASGFFQSSVVSYLQRLAGHRETMIRQFEVVPMSAVSPSVPVKVRLVESLRILSLDTLTHFIHLPLDRLTGIEFAEIDFGLDWPLDATEVEAFVRRIDALRQQQSALLRIVAQCLVHIECEALTGFSYGARPTFFFDRIGTSEQLAYRAPLLRYIERLTVRCAGTVVVRSVENTLVGLLRRLFSRSQQAAAAAAPVSSRLPFTTVLAGAFMWPRLCEIALRGHVRLPMRWVNDTGRAFEFSSTDARRWAHHLAHVFHKASHGRLDVRCCVVIGQHVQDPSESVTIGPNAG